MGHGWDFQSDAAVKPILCTVRQALQTTLPLTVGPTVSQEAPYSRLLRDAVLFGKRSLCVFEPPLEA